ncbi:hypothetical protein PLESTF_000027200 [Pleodorina starrii]|nr:hypothetical protein PLESTF_000027200 [Pleodorina starrii]
MMRSTTCGSVMVPHAVCVCDLSCFHFVCLAGVWRGGRRALSGGAASRCFGGVCCRLLLLLPYLVMAVLVSGPGEGLAVLNAVRDGLSKSVASAAERCCVCVSCPHRPAANGGGVRVPYAGVFFA